MPRFMHTINVVLYFVVASHWSALLLMSVRNDGNLGSHVITTAQVEECLMFYLICGWINGWVNIREAGDLRGRRAHYDVIVMTLKSITFYLFLYLLIWASLTLTITLVFNDATHDILTSLKPSKTHICASTIFHIRFRIGAKTEPMLIEC